MTLRPFAIDDAPIILSWIKDKTAFRKWSADRYPAYPPKPEDMLAQYKSDVIFPFTALDDEGKVVGHIMLRYPDPSKTVIRFGFVIVDDQLRGKGYGKQMLQLAIQKATHEFGAKKITLGVFDNNPSACIFTEQEQLLPEQMQAIAAEHKGFVMEVVFCGQSDVADCKLTYYSSECEVEFCRHGTIATMYTMVRSCLAARLPRR